MSALMVCAAARRANIHAAFRPAAETMIRSLAGAKTGYWNTRTMAFGFRAEKMKGAIAKRIAPINGNIRRNMDCALRSLNVSRSSVNSRFQRTIAKLGVPNRRMAARVAIDCGLIVK
jgi:hypothetical protein